MQRMWCLVILLLPVFVHAEQCSNFKRLGIGYTLDIDRVAYRALPAKDYKELNDLVARDQANIEKLQGRIVVLEAKLKASLANAAKYQKLLTEQAKLNQKYKDLNDSYSALNTKYSETAGKLVDLNKSYKSTLGEFDDLVSKYRKVAMRTNPRNKLDLGIGMLKPTANGADPHYFAMAGSGIKFVDLELRGWLLVGNNSYGAILGVSF